LTLISSYVDQAKLSSRTTNFTAMRNIILAGILLVTLTAQGQLFKGVKGEGKVAVQGTSTLHDWESVMESFTISFTVADKTINSVNFKGSVKSIKSGKKSMDKNTYEAMKADAHPNITFTGSGFNIENSKIKGTGKLTIAGKSKSIPVSMNLESWNSGNYNILGEIKFKMTDFGIEPPTAMFGTISTGDDVTIVFNFVVKS